MICLVIISRSSSDRWARLSTRTSGFIVSFRARSFCRTLDAVASPAAGEEAASDASCSSNRPNTRTSFPDMSEQRKERRTQCGGGDQNSPGSKWPGPSHLRGGCVQNEVTPELICSFYTKRLKGFKSKTDNRTSEGRKCVKEVTENKSSIILPFHLSVKMSFTLQEQYNNSMCLHKKSNNLSALFQSIQNIQCIHGDAFH